MRLTNAIHKLFKRKNTKDNNALLQCVFCSERILIEFPIKLGDVKDKAYGHLKECINGGDKPVAIINPLSFFEVKENKELRK